MSVMEVLFIGVLFVLHVPSEGYENLAQIQDYKGTPSMSSDFVNKWLADKAVDGQVNPGQGEESCSFTNSGAHKTAWWKFPLKLMSNLAYLQIHFRNATVNRHTGFSIYLFNETSFSPPSSGSGFKVFTQNSSTCPSQVMNVTINKEAKGVVLFNSKKSPLPTTCSGYEPNFATIEICEVLVIGCLASHFGTSCDFCETKCLGRHCDVFNGSCIYGCSDSLMQPPDCNVCLEGRYGPGCSHICGNCMTGTYCNSRSGDCPSGCRGNWYGNKCNVCRKGFYGSECTQTCGKCRTGTTCNSTTGFCIHGCQEHWDGDKCNICKDGWYHTDCTKTCGKCRNGTHCNKVTGKCPDSCQDRWAGIMCDRCKRGFYGPDCSGTCGKCKTGTFCNNITGVCADRCQDHWDGDKCDVCQDGFFGSNCTPTCGRCKTNTTCNKTNGICSDGCQNRWDGGKCDKCKEGIFGAECNIECGHCNVTSPACTQEAGVCLFGCQTKWNGSKCDEYIKDAEENTQSDETPVIAGTVSAGIILLIIGASIFIIYRRHNSKNDSGSVMETVRSFGFRAGGQKSTGNSFHDISENQSQEASDICDPETNPAADAGYYNTVHVNTNVNIVDLQDVISEKSTGKNNQFLIEYKRLPSANLNLCQAAKRTENAAKNRFKTTFPYEHSRIILKDKWNDSDNDYINANFIKDHNGDIVYIAAQGPKSNTLADFWRMIWQEKVKDIVMLTNIIENGKNKCTQYWPAKGKAMSVGPCKVAMLEETTYSFHVIRKFSVQRKDTHDKRTIRQFHYTAWPDHGTPEELQLVQFHKVVSKRKHCDAPLLVHCSAGVGRTGTFIGLDSLLKQGTETGRINVFEFVKQMREDRMTMVQTPEQYIFLHKALQCGFQEKDTVIPEGDLQSKIEALLSDNSPLNQRALYKEFKVLSTLKPFYDNEEKEDAKKPENKAKNSSMDILPVSKYRPFLTSYVKGRNDYINAVIVSTFTNPSGFILTQKPLPDTEVDLWRLCMDHEVAAMVVLSDGDEEIPWIPKRSLSHSCPPYTLTAGKSGSTINGVSQNTLVISSNEQKRDVDVFIIPFGDDESLVKGTELLLEKQKSSTFSAVVISKDGAGPAGIFCVLHNALQQLRMDGEVDIFTAVRQIQSRRPEVIAKLEEYRRCYQLVSLFVSNEGIYANM